MLSLENAMEAEGLVATRLVADEKIHRCGTIKKPKAKNGWYVVYGGGKAACFGNWERGDGYEYWQAEGWKGADRSRVRESIEELKKQREKGYETASANAVDYIERCETDGYSDYLKKKRCYPHGARFDGGVLAIPVQDAEGIIWSCQKIYGNGDKFFMSGGRTRGCYFPIFGRNVAKDERVIVCEGFATGAAIHQETGLPVVVAFSAGNLKPVCDSLPFRNLVIAADHDESGTGERFAKESGYPYVMPEKPGWDFSDVFLNGGDLKRYFFADSTKDMAPGTLRAHGLVQEIAEWITASAIREQPILSLAAALTFVGMLKGHRVRGGTDLRTNVLVLSLAPTGAGKDHPQYCIHKLAKACGLERHILGEPVSGAGFLTGLIEADRVGLLIQDEVGRYLANAGSKNAGTYQREIVDYIIKSFSCANSTLIGRQHADSKKCPRVNVENPHFCCLGSTVEDKLRQATSSMDIVDGFLNRWLVFCSRTRTPAKETSSITSPPESLIRRIESYKIIKNRYGEGENAKEVRFTPEAWDEFKAYRNKMEALLESAKYPLDRLYSRSAEHVEKVALILCDDEDIVCADVKVAIRIVEESNRFIMDFAGVISDNVFEEDFIRVKEIIKEEGELLRNVLTRRTQFITGGERRRTEIVNALIDDAVVVENKRGKRISYKYIGR